MKKIFAMVAVVLIACLSIVGVLTTDTTNSTYADTTKVTDIMEVETIGADVYYRINSSKGTGAIDKWLWACENIDKIDAYSKEFNKKGYLLIEEDLDFTDITNIKSLSYRNIKSNPNSAIISTNIRGGRLVDNAIVGFVPTIKNYKMTVNDEDETIGYNRGFVDTINGTTIQNLKFEGIELKGNANGGVGAVVGYMISGVIVNVSVNGNIICNTSNDVGGIVGVMDNGTIQGCDFNGEITAYENVGGMVGKIVAGKGLTEDGKNNGVNNIKIEDGYFNGKIVGENKIGGIIGNIDKSPILDTDLDKNIDIVVNKVYTYTTELVVNAIEYKQYQTILGAIDESIKLNGIRFKSLRTLSKVNGEIVSQTPTTIIPDDGKSFDVENFYNPENFNGFGIGKTWIMVYPKDNETDKTAIFDLKYKYDIKEVNAKIADTKSTSSAITELNNEKVCFIVNRDIVMSVDAYPGIHLDRVVFSVKQADGTSIDYTLYKAKPANWELDNNNFFTEYGNGAYDYKSMQLRIKPNAEGNYVVTDINDNTKSVVLFEKNADETISATEEGETGVFNFYFTEENNKDMECFNQYKVKAQSFIGEKEIMAVNGMNIAEIVTKTGDATNNWNVATDFTFTHDKTSKIYVFIDSKFEGVDLSTYTLNEKFRLSSRMKVDKFLPDINVNGSIKDQRINGTERKGTVYIFNLDWIDLYDKDTITLKFNFTSNGIEYSIAEDADKLDVWFIDNAGNVIDLPVYGQQFKMCFAIKKEYEDLGYILNLYDKNDQNQCIDVYIDNVRQDTQVELKDFTEKVGIGKWCFVNTEFQTFDSKTNTIVIDINVAKKITLDIKNINFESKVNIKGIVIPNLMIYDIPILAAENGVTYVTGYENKLLDYELKNVDKDITKPVTIATVSGINHNVKITANNDYYTLKSYYASDKKENFNLDTEGIGTLNLAWLKDSLENSFEVSLEYSLTKVKTQLHYLLDLGNGVKVKLKNVLVDDVEYASKKSYSSRRDLNIYKNVYKFSAWSLDNGATELPGDADGTFDIDAINKVNDTYVILKPLYFLKFNINKTGLNNGASIVIDGKPLINGDSYIFDPTAKDIKFECILSYNDNVEFTWNLISVVAGDDDKENGIIKFDENTNTFSVDYDKLLELRNSTDLAQVAKNTILDVKLDFNVKTFDISVTNDNIDGGKIIIKDSNNRPIETPDANGKYVLQGLLYGKSIIVQAIANERYKFVGWFEKIYNEDGSVAGEVQITEGVSNSTSGFNQVSTLSLNDIRQNREIVAKFSEDSEAVYHGFNNITIERGYVKDNNFVVKDTLYNNHNELVKFRFGVQIDGIDSSHVPTGTKVQIYHDLQETDKYEFYSWTLRYDGGENTYDTNNVIINSMDKDYDIIIRVVEKVYEVKVTFPNSIQLKVDGVVLDSSVLSQIGDKYIYTISVKHNGSLRLLFDDMLNPKYKVRKWVIDASNGKLEERTSNAYDMYDITDDYEIELFVSEKIGIIDDDTKILVKYDIDKSSTSAGSINRQLRDDGKIVLTATSGSVSNFVMWMYDGKEYSKDATIVVDNEEKTYYAVFEKKKFDIKFVNENKDVYKIYCNEKTVEAGTSIKVKIEALAGYSIEKIIINGKVINSNGEFVINDINEMQNIQVVYQKSGSTSSDEAIVKAVIIVMICACVLAFIIKSLLKRKLEPNKRKRIDRSKNINID